MNFKSIDQLYSDFENIKEAYEKLNIALFAKNDCEKLLPYVESYLCYATVNKADEETLVQLSALVYQIKEYIEYLETFITAEV